MTVKKITNHFDSTCGACGDVAWAGESVFYNPDAPAGKRVKHERCAGIAVSECADTLHTEPKKTVVEVVVRYSDGTQEHVKNGL